MTLDEKATAFDLLVEVLTNRWASGKWSAYCASMVDQPNRETRAECVPDLLAWAERVKKYNAKWKSPEGVVQLETRTTDHGHSASRPAASCATSAASPSES